MFNDLQKAQLHNKRVFLRVDLNVPYKDGLVIDATRAIKIKPTLDYLIAQGARVILASHLGRPGGKEVPECSFRNIIDSLSAVVGYELILAENLKEATLINPIKKQIILLENLRFHPGEEANDLDYAKTLAGIADIYVNDAFSCSHRAHASIEAIARLLPAYPGFLLLKEVDALTKAFDQPKKPVIAIVGGKKVSSKLPLLENLITKVDKLVIAGAMANTLLKATGVDIGNSSYEDNLLEFAQDFYAQHHHKLILPVDFIAQNKQGAVSVVKHLNKEQVAYDIGPKTCELIDAHLVSAKTIIWNGPLGMYEDTRFRTSTEHLARLIISYEHLFKIAGGGDTIAAIEPTGLLGCFNHVSTAGGAFLEWLEGRKLPGVEVLRS